MSLTSAFPSNSLDMWLWITLHTPGTSHQDSRQVLYLWDDLFLPDLNWPLIPVLYAAYRENRQNKQKQKSLKQGFRKCISKWARHHIWHLFLQVTTHAVWIMGAAVPSALPSQEAESVPALTTSSWRRTMSPVQVGGNNESDGSTGPKIIPSQYTSILASSSGTKIK